MNLRGVDWAGIAALVIAIIGAVLWLGRLDGRLSALESGRYFEQEKQRAIAEFRDSVSVLRAQLFVARQPASVPLGHPDASITEPRSGAAVDQVCMVRGTLSGVPDSLSLSLVVFAYSNGGYYPQSGTVDLEPSGEWSGRVEIGDASTRGGSFDILLVGAVETAHNTLREHSRLNLRDGVRPLPIGSQVLARVPVQRSVM